MKVKIICGFLGAGKTTFLKNILKGFSERTVVLVNEFGDIAIDGDIIKRQGGLEVIELPSGCICCVLRGDLIATVEQIFKEIEPERLIIEPSGIAAPSNILEALKICRLTPLDIEPIVGVIDASAFLDYYADGELANFFLDQISNSDILLINKCDLASPETVTKIERIIKNLNKTAIVFRTEYCRAPILSKHSKRKESLEIIPYHFDIHLDSITIREEETFDDTRIGEFLASLSSNIYGEVLRAKGVFKTNRGCIAFDYTPQNLNLYKIKNNYTSKFVAIGRKLDKKLLRKRILLAII
jgi:G3E family GTPase